MTTKWYPLIPPHAPYEASVIDAWVLECDHGLVTTDDVRRAFKPQEILNRLVSDRLVLPPETSNALTVVVAMRSLAGLLLTTRFGCPCGIDPLPLGALDPEAGQGPRC